MNYFEPKIRVVVFKCFVSRSEKKLLSHYKRPAALHFAASRPSLFSPVDVELPPDSLRWAL